MWLNHHRHQHRKGVGKEGRYLLHMGRVRQGEGMTGTIRGANGRRQGKAGRCVEQGQAKGTRHNLLGEGRGWGVGRHSIRLVRYGEGQAGRCVGGSGARGIHRHGRGQGRKVGRMVAGHMSHPPGTWHVGHKGKVWKGAMVVVMSNPTVWGTQRQVWGSYKITAGNCRTLVQGNQRHATEKVETPSNHGR